MIKGLFMIFSQIYQNSRLFLGFSFLFIFQALIAQPVHAQTKYAYFAGGCFWCVEEAFEKVAGVEGVVSGYTGGQKNKPTYKQVAGGHTSHYEAVKVAYNANVISYSELLAVFWRNIDPHNDRGQFCDTGPHYRAAIFVQNEQEKFLAKASKDILQTKAGLNRPIVTQISQAGKFYNAEDYHQDYYKLNAVRYSFYKSLCGRSERLNSVWKNIDIDQLFEQYLPVYQESSPQAEE